jgi:shikimate kinase
MVDDEASESSADEVSESSADEASESSADENVVITGFMGVGKTIVGRTVAERLSRPFLDMDTLIEAREGRPIRDIFADEGEAYFRRLESELCRELSARRGLVIATGGGALLDPDNLAAMSASGIVICLTCEPEVLLRRLPQDDTRPLLATEAPSSRSPLKEGERRERLLELLAARRAAYARIPHHIDTTALTPLEVAVAILDIFTALQITTKARRHKGK